MKILYYTNKLNENMKNTKKMWRIINEILKKQNKRRLYNNTYKHKWS